jgi:hypothetical protein
MDTYKPENTENCRFLLSTIPHLWDFFTMKMKNSHLWGIIFKINSVFLRQF